MSDKFKYFEPCRYSEGIRGKDEVLMYQLNMNQRELTLSEELSMFYSQGRKFNEPFYSVGGTGKRKANSIEELAAFILGELYQ